MSIVKYNGMVVRSAGGKWIGSSAAPQPGAVIGGKTYPTVIMPDGNEWLAVNLDYAWNGLSVPTSPPTQATSNDPQAMYYNYDEATYGWEGYKCGLLYNWRAVEYLEQNKSTLCPGWHVPSRNELADLATALGGKSVAGTKLKALDHSVTSQWPSNFNGTDDYGFSALPAGQFLTNSFSDIGTKGGFWSSRRSDEYRATNYYVDAGSTWFQSADSGIQFQKSVRLVKDS